MKFTIEQDVNATNPSEFGDTNLFIVANHPDFYVPEPDEKRITLTAKELVKKYKKTHWIFPLEAYIHSGVVLSFSSEGNFPDRRWDVSQLGYVFAAKEEWRLSKSAKKAAQGKIDEWNQYLSGDVWGYIITDDNDKEIDSCWGFYGKEYCEETAKSTMEALQKAA